MINASPAFLSANADLVKQPLYLLEIAGAPYVFSNGPTGENLLKYSEQFDNAAWSGTSVTVTPNNQTDPVGGLTADTLAFASSASEGFWGESLGIVPKNGEVYTFSVWLRAAAPVNIGLRFVQATGQNDTTSTKAVTTAWQRFSYTAIMVSVGTGALQARFENPPSTGAVTVYAWGGQVERAQAASAYQQTTSAASAPKKPWLVSIADQSSTVNEMDGSADLGELDVVVQDVQGAVTATFPGFVYEGKTVTLKTGYAGMAFSDYCLLFTGVVDSVPSVNNNLEYQFVCTDNKQVLTKVIYATGDDGQPTSSDHIKTLNAHPLDILLDILRNQIGLPDAQIDVARIITYRDGIFSGAQFIFALDSPPAANEFIAAQLMKPLGGYIWTNSQGQISVNFNYIDTPSVAMTLDSRVIVGIPEPSQIDLINTISYRMDKSSGGKYMLEIVQQYQPSITKYGQFGQQVVESDGMRSALQGSFLSALSARFIFLKYGSKAIKFDQAVEVLWTGCVLEPGDIVALTHAAVPDRTLGVIGITNRQFVVLDRTLKFEGATVELTLLDASFLSSFGAFKIAPDATLTYTSAPALDKTTYMFMCLDTDLYSNNDPAHILG